MATSEGHCSQNVNISLVLQILFDGLFSGQSGHSSKELLCLKNLVLAHSIFDDTSNEKRRKMKTRLEKKTQIQICMFHQTSVSVAPNELYQPPQRYQRSQPYERYSNPILTFVPEEQGQLTVPILTLIWPEEQEQLTVRILTLLWLGGIGCEGQNRGDN